MLVIRDHAYFERVVAFACAKGLAEALFEQLLFLHRFADPDGTSGMQVMLARDFAPASFALTWCRTSPSTGERRVLMNGGLIYHGDQRGWRLEDGTVLSEPRPTFAMLLCPIDNPWSIHT